MVIVTAMLIYKIHVKVALFRNSVVLSIKLNALYEVLSKHLLPSQVTAQRVNQQILKPHRKKSVMDMIYISKYLICACVYNYLDIYYTWFLSAEQFQHDIDDMIIHL